jgi:2-amino-4-hydroxy-6-hydroxymethyldihydropteridine diphosphokinase
MVAVFLGLGSNIEPRETHIYQAIEQIEVSGKIRAISSFYQSAALLPEGADPSWNIPFLNAVLSIDTESSASELLEGIKNIEEDIGRQVRGHWAPREIDIDILLYEEEVFDESTLAIPHPEMLKRTFVMFPLAEIAPELTHPTAGQTMKALASELSDDTIEIWRTHN